MLKRCFSKQFILLIYTPIILLIIVLILFCNTKVEQYANNRIYNNVNNIPYNKVGLLLGTCKTLEDKVTINPYWQYRLEAAYTLWQHHKVSKILISGDNGWYGYNEPDDFKKALLQMGVPDSALVCDYAGFRTHDSVIRCKKVFGQQKVTIISQEFHNKRALVIATYFGMNCIAYNATDIGREYDWYNFIRERLARVKLFLDLYLLHTEPHFLGDPITI